MTLVVQADPVIYYPAFPLLTEYWTHPFDAQIREWYSIMGHWLRAPEGFYAPYNDTPSTAHILWQRPLGEDQGGLVGGMALTDQRYFPEGTDSFENGDAYEGRWPVQFIVGGILYYYPYETGILDQPVVAIDLRTGKELWIKTFMGNTSAGIANVRPSFTQIIDWKCFNNDGAFMYLGFSTTNGIGNTVLSFYDAYSGNLRYNITNVPGGTTAYGQLGEQLTAPNIGVQQGTSVIISGTVTDVSPGTEEYALRARFPNGVTAMSDASQSDWMLYVYRQFTIPTDATGVDVQLNVIDSNGNFRSIGTATTDASGTYSLQWTPDIPGKYTIIATFTGSGAYYGSFAQTAMGVDTAPDPTAAPTPVPPSVSDLYLVPGISAIIVTIAIVGAVLALLVIKKKP